MFLTQLVVAIQLQTPSAAPGASSSTLSKTRAELSTEPSTKSSSKPSLIPSERPSTEPSSEPSSLPSARVVFLYYPDWLEMGCKRKGLDEFSSWESDRFDNVADCCSKMYWGYMKCIQKSELLIDGEINDAALFQTSYQPSNSPSSLPSSQNSSKPYFESSIHHPTISLGPIIHPGIIYSYYPDWLETRCKRKALDEFRTWESDRFENVGDCCYKSFDWEYMKCIQKSMLLIEGEINDASSQPSLEPSLQPSLGSFVSSSSQPSSKPGSERNSMPSESSSHNSSTSIHASGLPSRSPTSSLSPSVWPNSTVEESKPAE